MPDPNKLDCKIYVETTETLDELVALLLPVLSAPEPAQSPSAWTIHTTHGDVEIRHNEEADTIRAREFPDGFLYFSFGLELYPLATTSHQAQVDQAAALLHSLWSQGVPAVAACDYESELPNGGGYKDASLPWPAKVNGFRDPPDGKSDGKTEMPKVTASEG
jgi:hypothetical protein